MSFSHERIVALAAETSFRPETLEKVLGKLLSEISSIRGVTGPNDRFGVLRVLADATLLS